MNQLGFLKLIWSFFIILQFLRNWSQLSNARWFLYLFKPLASCAVLSAFLATSIRVWFFFREFTNQSIIPSVHRVQNQQVRETQQHFTHPPRSHQKSMVASELHKDVFLIAPGLEVYCSCFLIQNSKFLAFSCVLFFGTHSSGRHPRQDNKVFWYTFKWVAPRVAAIHVKIIMCIIFVLPAVVTMAPQFPNLPVQCIDTAVDVQSFVCACTLLGWSKNWITS